MQLFRFAFYRSNISVSKNSVVYVWKYVTVLYNLLYFIFDYLCTLILLFNIFPQSFLRPEKGTYRGYLWWRWWRQRRPLLSCPEHNFGITLSLIDIKLVFPFFMLAAQAAYLFFVFRAETSVPRLCELNPYVTINTLTSSLDDSTDLQYLRQFNVRNLNDTCFFLRYFLFSLNYFRARYQG